MEWRDVVRILSVPSYYMLTLTVLLVCTPSRVFYCTQTAVYDSPKTAMQVQCAFKQGGGGGVVIVEQTLSYNSTERSPVLRRLRVTPLSFCLKVIVIYINL